MKKRVGIVLRPDTILSGKNVYILLDSIRKIIISYNCIPVPISPNTIDVHQILSDEKQIELVNEIKNLDGIILQGGNDFYDYDRIIAKYFLNNDIPILGICLGAQLLSSISENNLEKIDLDKYNNHLFNDHNIKHEIIIDKNSFLYEIIKEEKILVNSFHKSMIKPNSKFTVSAYSIDNVVEAIEFKNKKFALGLQWHPEKEPYDKYNKKIFDKFFDTIKRNRS